MHVPHNNKRQLLAVWTNFRQDYVHYINEEGRTAPCPKIGCTLTLRVVMATESLCVHFDISICNHIVNLSEVSPENTYVVGY